MSRADLESLGKFQVGGKTIAHDVDSKKGPREEDLRSLRSEYDYGVKKNFSDILSQNKKNSLGKLNNGALNDINGANKNYAASGKSNTSSKRYKNLERLASMKGSGIINGGSQMVPIAEENFAILDKDGNQIELTD